MSAWQPPEFDFWSVPRCWPGECVAILGGGGSLTQEQVDHCRGKCRVIAINRACVPKPAGHVGKWVYAPFADWAWGTDVDRFWKWHPEMIEHPGTKIVVRKICPSRDDWRAYAALAAKGVKVIRHSGEKHPILIGKHEGASGNPGVVHGNNAAMQIMSVIHHTGVSTVLLLGLDMRGVHWHGGYRHMGAPDYATAVVPNFASLVKPLENAGVTVLNCSQRSILKCWTKVELEAVL